MLEAILQAGAQMQNPIVLSEDDVANLLSYNDLILLMKEAMSLYSQGLVNQPTRNLLPVEVDQRYLGIMPALLPHAMGAKLVTFYPKNANTGIPTHNAMIALLDVEHGLPLAFISGRLITEMRTAALSAAVSTLLARPDSKSLALIGSGVQAHAHLEALRHVFKLDDVRVWSPTKSHADSFADKNGARSLPLEQAVTDADIVVVATNSTQPVLRGAWLKPGVHVNSVGSPRPNWRELDDDVMRNDLIVDCRVAAMAEAGDVILSKANIIGEAGELFAGKVTLDPSRTTVFKSVGLAVQDVATAHFLYLRAVESAAN